MFDTVGKLIRQRGKLQRTTFWRNMWCQCDRWWENQYVLLGNYLFMGLWVLYMQTFLMAIWCSQSQACSIFKKNTSLEILSYTLLQHPLRMIQTCLSCFTSRNDMQCPTFAPSCSKETFRERKGTNSHEISFLQQDLDISKSMNSLGY